MYHVGQCEIHVQFPFQYSEEKNETYVKRHTNYSISILNCLLKIRSLQKRDFFVCYSVTLKPQRNQTVPIINILLLFSCFTHLFIKMDFNIFAKPTAVDVT